MAIKTLGRMTSLAYTKVTGQTPDPDAGPITFIQEGGVTPNDEIAAFLMGTARVDSHFQGKQSTSIRITTGDVAKYPNFRKGQQFTAVIATFEAALASNGLTTGQAMTATLSHAVINEISELRHSNEDSTPVVYDIEFILSRFPDATSDPTVTIAAAA